MFREHTCCFIWSLRARNHIIIYLMLALLRYDTFSRWLVSIELLHTRQTRGFVRLEIGIILD